MNNSGKVKKDKRTHIHTEVVAVKMDQVQKVNKYNCRCEASRGKPHAQKMSEEGHNMCTSEWQILGAILKANTV